MRALARCMAVCGVLAAAGITAAGAGAASSPKYWTFRSNPIAVGHGWKAYLIAGHSGSNASMAVSFAKGGQINEFSVQTGEGGSQGFTVTGNGDKTETIKGKFGKLGSINMTFTATGREHKICGQGTGRNGKVKGSLHFSDGKPFKLSAKSARGTLSDFATESMTSFCPRSGPTGRPTLNFQSYGFSGGVSRFFSASRYRNGKVYLFGQLRKTLADQLFAQYTVSQTGSGAQFTSASDLSSATVKGAGAFSGTVNFHATQKQSMDANGTLSGTLKTTFAGIGKRAVAVSGDQGTLNKF